MTIPVIGWEQDIPVPNHSFNDFLHSRDGHLYLDELDLARLFFGEGPWAPRRLSSPLEIVYLPRIRQKIEFLQRVFDEAIRETGYAGCFLYTYPSKANLAEEVVRTVLKTGVHYEISSAVDVDIVRLMRSQKILDDGRMVICNGFKPVGLAYTDRILQLQKERGNVIPIIEELNEIQPLIEAGVPFDVGIRQKSYGHHNDQAGMEMANSRFGMKTEDIWQAAGMIDTAPNLRLKVYHAMVGSQIVDEDDFIRRLTPPLEIYARLRKQHPHLSIFDFGGGMPVAMTLSFDFDYHAFARLLLTTIQAVCRRCDVPVPDVMGEIGRYTVTEHGVHCFRVVQVKENGSDLPWYLIDGSIMTSFPDSWALGEHFVVLPINHLDKPFRRVQLGGLTCDSDDIYPPKNSQSPLFLPVDTDDLYIGFFNIGAYQEMLGGVGGAKHCVIPEADELVIDRDAAGRWQFRLLPGQSVDHILNNLGYSLK